MSLGEDIIPLDLFLYLSDKVYTGLIHNIAFFDVSFLYKVSIADNFLQTCCYHMTVIHFYITTTVYL